MRESKQILLTLLMCIFSLNVIAQEKEFPIEEWQSKSASELKIDQLKIDKLFDLSFEDDATQSVVLIKNGFLVGERYADGYDQQSYGTSWSMAKSFYSALIGISLELGEISSIDDNVGTYLSYFNDERSVVTIRDLLDMTSGLEFPEHEHEIMFFRNDQIEYVKSIGMEKAPKTLFEYNNVNSMLLGEILLQVTGKKADVLLRERIFDKIGIEDATLWQDGSGNVMTYCCIDMSARDYSKFGLLFSRNGNWNGDQVIPANYVDETFSTVWESTPNWWTDLNRGYSLHWWISKNDEEGTIFNASGKFGQYIFVDRENDIIFTRITKYHPMPGSIQNWSFLKYLDISNVDLWISILRIMHKIGLIDLSEDITTPNTFPDGESNEFYTNYEEIIDAMADLSRD
ncbi:MAG: CubicO group peptidase (beta-lactamase class C family) [Woeseiaceae bacterium]|jgi:CubicO group peptidase (beta-lactamase class C family)